MTPVEQNTDQPPVEKTKIPNEMEHAAVRAAISRIQSVAMLYDGFNIEIVAHEARCKKPGCTAAARQERAKLSLQLVAAARELETAATKLSVVHVEPVPAGAAN